MLSIDVFKTKQDWSERFLRVFDLEKWSVMMYCMNKSNNLINILLSKLKTHLDHLHGHHGGSRMRKRKNAIVNIISKYGKFPVLLMVPSLCP